MNKTPPSLRDITRVKRGRQKAKRHYDMISHFYDLLEGGFEKEYRAMGVEELGVNAGDHVLEIGFGTGEALITLGELVGSRGAVAGIDISTGMASISKSKLEREGAVDNISLVCGDAVDLPFKGEFFDKVFLSLTLELFDTPDIPKVINEIKRVMKVGGKIGLVSLSKEESIFVDIYEFFHDLFPVLIDCRPIYVEEILKDGGFTIDKNIKERIVGLPINIVVAERT